MLKRFYFLIFVILLVVPFAFLDLQGKVSAQPDNFTRPDVSFIDINFKFDPVPGPEFDFYGPPVASCEGVKSIMTVSWTPSNGAVSYRLTPQTNNTAKRPGGFYPEINVGNPATNAFNYKSYSYEIPGVVAPNEGWEFALRAVDSADVTTPTSAGSSYYQYGWIVAQNCLPKPTVDFYITAGGVDYPAGQGRIVNSSQNSLVYLKWIISNADSTSATSNPVQAYWTGSGPISLVNGASSGQQQINTSLSGSINFTLSATNSTGTTGPNGIQINIQQSPKPFFQTTGGDVHSNESINITP